MAPLFSIIVPVYNTANYLRGCVQSILNQSYVDFELILVDDGSTDGSAGICDRFAGQDERVICIHQSNAGVSAARNRALDISSGEYIWFCDSDDTVAENALAELAAVVLEKSPAMVVFPLERVGVDGHRLGLIPVAKTNADPNSGPLQNGDPIYPQQRITMRSVIADSRFDTALAYLEDRAFFYPICWAAAGDTIALERPLYHYLCNREGSAVNSVTPEMYLKALEVNERILCSEIQRGYPMPAFEEYATLAFAALKSFACKVDVGTQRQHVCCQLKRYEEYMSLLSKKCRLKCFVAMKFPAMLRAAVLVKSRLR